MTNYKIYCGLDPGLTGYVAILDENGSFKEVYKTPTITTAKNKKSRITKKTVVSSKTILDEDNFVIYLQSLVDKYESKNILFCIEKQHPMSKQGLASTAKTMFNYGFMIGALKAFHIPLVVTTARNWQKALLNPNEEDTKKASVEYVLQFNKDISLKRTNKSRKDDHNMADSICIARFVFLENQKG